jgi:hypothetical protein
MWILDSGMIGSERYCPPELIVVDLSTDTIIHRYTFPESQFTHKSIFIKPVSD